jgi:hypothetical protein
VNRSGLAGYPWTLFPPSADDSFYSINSATILQSFLLFFFLSEWNLHNLLVNHNVIKYSISCPWTSHLPYLDASEFLDRVASLTRSMKQKLPERIFVYFI